MVDPVTDHLFFREADLVQHQQEARQQSNKYALVDFAFEAVFKDKKFLLNTYPAYSQVKLSQSNPFFGPNLYNFPMNRPA